MESHRNDIPKLSLIHPNHLGLESIRAPSPPSIKRRKRYTGYVLDRYPSTPIPIPTHIIRFPDISSWSCNNVYELWEGVDQIIHKQKTTDQLRRGR
jgi:hypothetical protein